jgi:L-threonylcarbamoyladenylate synthase
MSKHWNPAQLAPWLAALKAGEVAAAPAEGVYGYVADPFNPKALQKLIQLKQRDPAKGFIVLIDQLAQLQQLCPQPLPPYAAAATRSHWPYPPVTLILPALPTLPPLLTGGTTTIAVRYPAVDYMLEYLAAFGGPLVSTSLNISGEPPAIQASQIAADVPALTLAEPLSGRPSRIYDPEKSLWLR